MTNTSTGSTAPCTASIAVCEINPSVIGNCLDRSPLKQEGEIDIDVEKQESLLVPKSSNHSTSFETVVEELRDIHMDLGEQESLPLVPKTSNCSTLTGTVSE